MEEVQVLIESDWNLKWEEAHTVNAKSLCVLIESDWNLKVGTSRSFC